MSEYFHEIPITKEPSLGKMINDQIPITNELSMSQCSKGKKFDLEERTFAFSILARDYVKTLPRSLTNLEYAKQLARSAGSVGANYIEANEAVSRKDFVLRLKIVRKECKETSYWLRLSEPQVDQIGVKEGLIQESKELVRIFSTIIERTIANKA